MSDESRTARDVRIDRQERPGTEFRHTLGRVRRAGRPDEALRADWQAHLREAVTSPGARYFCSCTQWCAWCRPAPPDAR